jgi:hypothetical protein
LQICLALGRGNDDFGQTMIDGLILRGSFGWHRIGGSRFCGIGGGSALQEGKRGE